MPLFIRVVIVFAIELILVAQALPLTLQITLINWNMNHFNICPTCKYIDGCVLTTQKDKVWSCSEFSEIVSFDTITEIVLQEKLAIKELEEAVID